MAAFIVYTALVAGFLWICWQVAGAYAEYQERGDILEERAEIIDILTANVADLERENGLLQADNKEKTTEIYQTRHINRRLRQEVEDVNAAMKHLNPTRN